MPIHVTQERFEELVSEALDTIPAELAQHMENVAVVVQDWPTKEQQEGHRGMLLGLYQGVDLTRRGPMSHVGAMPDRITIFQGPHCRMVTDLDQLRRRIAVTVVHEVGHHFGISDARLHQLGWTWRETRASRERSERAPPGVVAGAVVVCTRRSREVPGPGLCRCRRGGRGGL